VKLLFRHRALLSARSSPPAPRRQSHATLVALCLMLCAQSLISGCATSPSSTSAETQRAHVLFDHYWKESAELHPEWATFRGDHRFGNRLTDASLAGKTREFDFWRGILAALDRLDVRQLGREDQLSVALLRQRCVDVLALESYPGARSLTVNAAPFPFQGDFAALMRNSPVQTEAQVEQLLARMAAYPTRVDQEIDSLRRGMAAGWVPSQPVLREVLRQLDVQLAAALDKSAYYEPFTRLGSAIPPALQASLAQRGAQRIAQDVQPAVRRLREFVAGPYLAAAPAEGACRATRRAARSTRCTCVSTPRPR